jgi:hypothetical protein
LTASVLRRRDEDELRADGIVRVVRAAGGHGCRTYREKIRR